MKLQTNGRVKELLQKDLNFAKYAVMQLRSEMASFEKKRNMQWKIFLKKFKDGKLGDDRAWFKWYALTQFTLDWDATQKEIKETLRDS